MMKNLKHVLLGTLAVLAVLFLTGCDNKDNPVRTSLNVDTSTLTLAVGESATRTATTKAQWDYQITYTSSNPAVATVDQNGKVTAVSEGEAVITVEMAESIKSWYAAATLTYNVVVKEKEPGPAPVVAVTDLSMVDCAGNARATMSTANCYMVHTAGDYKLPLVYGNAIKNGYTEVADCVLYFDAYATQSLAVIFDGVDFNTVKLAEGTELPEGFTLEGGVLSANGSQPIASCTIPVVLEGIDGYITMNANIQINVIDPIHVSTETLKVGEEAAVAIDAPYYQYGSLIVVSNHYANTLTDAEGNPLAKVENPASFFGNNDAPGTGDPIEGGLNVMNWYWRNQEDPYGKNNYECLGHIAFANAQSTDTRYLEMADVEAGNYYKAFLYELNVSEEDQAKLAEYGLNVEKVMTSTTGYQGISYDVNTALAISGTPSKAGTVDFTVTVQVPLVRGFGAAFPNNVHVTSPVVTELTRTVTLTIGE
mgnify:CR=1 FL=1